MTAQTGTGTYGLQQTDGTTAVGTYVGGSSSGATGGWFGTLSASPLHFFTGGGQPSMTISPTGNVGIGTSAPLAKLHVTGDVFVGLNTVPDNATTPGNNLYLADAVGDPKNSFRLDANNNNLYFVARSPEHGTPGYGGFGAGIVFRTGHPQTGTCPFCFPAELEADRVVIDPTGLVSIKVLAQGSIGLCRTNFNEIANCSSSLRYKKDVAHFVGGLDIVNRLRPISFAWKQSGSLDIGLAAEK